LSATTKKTMTCQVCGAAVVNNVCTECGAKVQGSSLPVSHAVVHPPPPDNTFHPELKECPVDRGGCGTPRAKVTPFCNLCRFDFRKLQPNDLTPKPAGIAASSGTPAASAPPAEEKHAHVLLQATISLDPALYTEPVDGVVFPANPPAPATLPIDGERVLFGRPSHRDKSVVPDIPFFTEDHGVGNQHFELVLMPDGRYQMHQLHKNGVLVNDKPLLKDDQEVVAGRIECVLGYFTRVVIEPRPTVVK